MFQHIMFCNFGVRGAGYNWYVDSVNGLDTNTGKSAAQAFRTIAALESAGISAGDRIGLARGSHWREQLDINAANVTVEAYGSGDRPLIDCSDIIASFTKTDGQTNVYQADVLLANAVSDNYVTAFEDGDFLKRVADVATCDATPGSYYPSAEGGSITLYVHPTGSTNPASDGKMYEVNSRYFGVVSTGQYTTLRSLRTRRNLGGSGSIRIAARHGRLYDVHADQGTKHNFYFQSGAILQDCSANDARFSSNTALYVYNENLPTGDPVSFINCVAQAPTLDTSNPISAVYGHPNNPAGMFGPILFDGCTALNINNGFIIGSDKFESTTIRNCVAENVQYGIGAYSNMLIDGFTMRDSVAGTCITVGGAYDVVIKNVTVTNSRFSVAVIFANYNANIDLSDSSFTVIPGSINRGVQLTQTGASLKMYRVAFDGDGVNFGQQVMCSGTPALDLDYNSYQWPAWQYAGSNILDFDVWRATTGQDIHSTVG